MAETIKIEGAAELGRAIDGVAKQIQNLDRGAADAGSVVAADARHRAPVRTGNLARSITAVVGKGGSVVVGTPVRYGAPVHQGVPSRGQSAQPFLTDALSANQSAVLEAYRRDLQHAVTSQVASKAKH